jgi:hypothetical protein
MDNLDIDKRIQLEIERRRTILINLSYDNSFDMVQSERIRIQSILEKWESPTRPADVRILTKQFCTSAFSYAPLRKYLASFIGNFPMRDTIHIALNKAFNNDSFLIDSNWSPESLRKLSLNIQAKDRYDLSRKQFKPRMISVLITGTEQLSNELKNGIDSFYKKISDVTSPPEMWELAKDFSVPISNLGPALACDFFKELGFTRYVKVDHHFRREFPELITYLKTCDQNPKESFILSQKIADSIGITPFHLDSILYLWGRYGRK